MEKQGYHKNRRLRVFAGPNGSGKSTILNQIDIKFDIGYYVNADILEQKLRKHSFIDLREFGISDYSQREFDQFLKNHSIFQKAKSEGYKIDIKLDSTKIITPDNSTHSYEASLLSGLIRNKLLQLGKKFTFETVLSHRSKIEFLEKTQNAGYKNYLYYISTESPIINIERVRQRVKLGGHPVKESKIESRYFNSLGLLREVINYTYRAFIFDNSGKDAQLILEIYKGEEVSYHYKEIPKWIDQYLLR